MKFDGPTNDLTCHKNVIDLQHGIVCGQRMGYNEKSFFFYVGINSYQILHVLSIIIISSVFFGDL